MTKARSIILGLTLLGCGLGSAESEFRTFTSTNGTLLVARILAKGDDSVTLLRKRDNREFTIPLTRLSPPDRKYVLAWSSEAENEPATAAAQETDWSQVEKHYYSRTLQELREGLEEIQATPQGNHDERMHRSLVDLNAFRFCCNVPLVKLDRTLIAQAMEAAMAVEAHGSLSHDLGHYTANCSLGGAKGNFSKPEVPGFISDHGEGNRRHRGHRLEGLHWQLEQTGFGFAGGFMAHRVQVYTGKPPKESYAFPGKGLYPLSRMVSNGWSLYLPEPAPLAERLEVQVWKLPHRPTERIGSGDVPDGEELQVEWVSVERFAINFEPSTAPLNKEPGISFVRIKGGGVRESYVVDLFDDTGWPCEYKGRYR